MTREKIGEVYTDNNGKAKMSLDLSDITQDFTIEAIYDEFNDSIDFTNVTYTLTLESEETQIGTGDFLDISGELTGDDGSLVDYEAVYIRARNENTGRVYSQSVILENGEYETTFHYLRDGIYTIYASWRNNRVISDSITITVGEPELTLTSEKQYIDTSTDRNSLILTGQYMIGTAPQSGVEIKIYDGSTLISTKTTNTNGVFELPLSNISSGVHLYKAVCGELESEFFEVFIGNGNEIIIETTSNTITFGYTETKMWLDTNNQDAIVDFGDGTTTTVNNPKTKLSHTFNDNKQKHMIVIYNPNSDIYGIGYEFLYNDTNITNVTIGSIINFIGSRAFYGCTGLQSIHIPDAIYAVGESAFEGCTGLQTVIMERIYDLRNRAFYGCTSITEYKLFWKGGSARPIIQYDSNIFQTNLLTKFTVPTGQKNNYIAKGYPADKIEEGNIEITITSNKTEYNMDDQVIIYITLKEMGLPIRYGQFNLELTTILTTWTATLTVDDKGELSGTLGAPIRTGGQDIDIKVTYQNASDVLNIDGNIYKNSLQQQDPSNWILKDASISYDENGLELLGSGDGALILNKKLFKYGYYPITIEYDLIRSQDGYSYLNYLFDENLEDKLIQLAKKPYGANKGTILDEYPYANNWTNTLIETNDHVKIQITQYEHDANVANLILFVNNVQILKKTTYYTNVENKLFAFGTVQGSNAVYKNLKISYEENYNISLSADKTTIEPDEVATITASISKVNKKLHYQVKNGTTLMYEGDVVTNTNGQASITYTGTGAGEIDIIFTYFDIKKTIRITDGSGKIQTIITLTSPTDYETFYTDETINIEGVLTDKNGNPLANKTIKIDNTEVQ